MKTLPLAAAFSFICVLLAIDCQAQEIEPRRWSHLPIGSNFLGGGYAYTTGEIFLDPILKIEDAEFDIQTASLKYIHSFELLGKSARVDVWQSYQSGEWTGLLNGTAASTSRDGWNDTNLRFAINLFGAPPLSGKEFQEYRAKAKNDTIIGAGLGIQLPTGEYIEEKLINLGANRFNFRPQLGIVHGRGNWSTEVTTAIYLFTDNDDFLSDKRLSQDPVFGADASLIYNFRPGLWISASIGYGYGGESTVDGVAGDNLLSNLGYGLAVGIPLSRSFGIKINYIGTHTYANNGLNSDTIAAGFSFMW
jgi:Putative MetA-pathway of phenol degradation